MHYSHSLSEIIQPINTHYTQSIYTTPFDDSDYSNYCTFSAGNLRGYIFCETLLLKPALILPWLWLFW